VPELYAAASAYSYNILERPADHVANQRCNWVDRGSQERLSPTFRQNLPLASKEFYWLSIGSTVLPLHTSRLCRALLSNVEALSAACAAFRLASTGSTGTSTSTVLLELVLLVPLVLVLLLR
jgi:hypothetical protein